MLQLLVLCAYGRNNLNRLNPRFETVWKTEVKCQTIFRWGVYLVKFQLLLQRNHIVSLTSQFIRKSPSHPKTLYLRQTTKINRYLSDWGGETHKDVSTLELYMCSWYLSLFPGIPTNFNWKKSEKTQWE